GFDYGAVCWRTHCAVVAGPGSIAMTAPGGRWRSGPGARVRKRERRRCKSGAPKVHGLPRFAAFCKVDPRKYAANRTRQTTRARPRAVEPGSADRLGEALHRELPDLLAHRPTDLCRVAVVHAVVDASHRNLLGELPDARPRAHGPAGRRAGRAELG